MPIQLMNLPVSPEYHQTRLDVFLANCHPDLSRKKAAALIESGAVRVDDRLVITKAFLVSAGQTVAIDRPTTVLAASPDETHFLAVLYEDDDLAAVIKPGGVHSAPQRGGERGTLAQFLLARFPEMAAVGFSPLEPGLCHRLDFWTSGVLLAAKKQPIFKAVRLAFDLHEIKKEYLALCAGSPPDRFRIEAPIAHPTRRAAHVVTDEKKGRGAVPAATEFETLEHFAHAALVRAVCHTGAMHQVRAHLKEAGHPLLGDTVYGGPPEPDKRFWLHAATIELPHPRTRRPLFVECPLPADFEARLAALHGENPPETEEMDED
ncbi:MAG: RluA family pseudouridine synthase [Myxococcales bacterium]|nr:RluA family pseudouridine synthase [Myxococcales bacterium]